jgi:SAM-dependent methyltransferase
MFDKNWENNIYKKNRQINNYPSEWVVSNTYKYIIKKNNCLDLGSGAGNNLYFFLKYGFKNIDSIEGSDTACKIQRKKFKNNKKIKVFNLDFNKFKFKKDNYNLILDRGSITHNKFNDIKKILSKISKSLKKDGYFFSVIFSSQSSYTAKKDGFAFKKILNEKIGLRANFFSESEIKKLLKDFTIVNLTLQKNETKIPNNSNISVWNIICQKKIS